MAPDTLTKTVESGAFIRTTWRRNAKRKQKTKCMQQNDQKVVLGHIGDYEIYVYPYNFPDTVFIGRFPTSTQITLECVNELITAYHRSKWFLKGEWQNKPNWRKGVNSRKRKIVSAYDKGLEQQKKVKNGSV